MKPQIQNNSRLTTRCFPCVHCEGKGRVAEKAGDATAAARSVCVRLPVHREKVSFLTSPK